MASTSGVLREEGQELLVSQTVEVPSCSGGKAGGSLLSEAGGSQESLAAESEEEEDITDGPAGVSADETHNDKANAAEWVCLINERRGHGTAYIAIRAHVHCDRQAKQTAPHPELINEHRFLHCRVPKVVFKVPSGTLDKVSSKMDHQRDLIFLSTLKPEESVSYRKGQTKAEVVTGQSMAFTQFVCMFERWMPIYCLCQLCARAYDFSGLYGYLESDAGYVLRHIGAPLRVHFPKRQTLEQTDVVGLIEGLLAARRVDYAYWRNWLGAMSVAWLPGAFRECCGLLLEEMCRGDSQSQPHRRAQHLVGDRQVAESLRR
ncbi:hypothetical protein DPEC_G00301400 [Dallia pectoralis]|uniref:Uncharacterized protein n=1 Tax=Dallia pectoralis TaxID=75939 RepID=A0ACC2FH12_DALPE|nr:hypothetical protein DPEC_G00301400 [Dallia pectoralis]